MNGTKIGTAAASALTCIIIISAAIGFYNILLKINVQSSRRDTEVHAGDTYTVGSASLPEQDSHDMTLTQEAPSSDDISLSAGTTSAANTIPAEDATEYIVADISSFIDRSGMTVRTRFKTPENYTRKSYPENSFQDYICNFPLLDNDSRIMLYNGAELENQTWRGAVLNLSIGKRDRQQCADSIIRLIADYLYNNKRYEEINFNLTNGFVLKYSDWIKGNRLIVEGNKTRLKKTAGEDAGGKTYEEYLDTVFLYAGTRSLGVQSQRLELSDIFPGSFFVMGGSPGHAVMVMDTAVNDATGDIAFLLAQGNMPAQSMHIFLNPLHINDPWFYVSEISDAFLIPFRKFSVSSLSYLIK